MFKLKGKLKELADKDYVQGDQYEMILNGKKVMLEENPLNEDLMYGDAEDLEWSLRVRDKAKYVMNPNSIVRHIRPKYTGDEPRI